MLITRRSRKSTVEFGMRIPFGIEFLLRDLPFDFFAEIMPVIVLTSGSSLSLCGFMLFLVIVAIHS